MKTIVIFTTYAFSLTNFRGKLIQELVKRSHIVHTIAPDHDLETRERLSELGATCHDCHFERAGTNIVSDLKAALHLYSLLKQINPDCMLSYFIKPVIYGTVCGFFSGVGHRVAMIEGLGSVFSDNDSKISVSKWLRRALVSKMYKIALIFTNETVFLNQDDVDFFDSRSILKASKATLLGGIGIDLKEWVNKAPVQSPVTFIMAARLLREKGVVDFANAARQVKASCPEARFILLGGLDPNPTSLTFDEVNSWVCEGIIEWPGHVPVMEWLSVSSVFVLPSYYREGIPRSSQEALAMGLPIITTDSVGCRETVTNGVNGYMIPIKNVDILVEKMLIFVNNPELIFEMGKRSRDLAEFKFSEDKKITIQLDILNC